jgi:hypothetical protein
LGVKYSETRIHQFVRAFVESKKGELIEQSDEIFTIKYPNQTSATEYTYDPAVSRAKKSLLMSPGSPAFQQILKQCLETGILCQILLNPKENFETILKEHLKDSPFDCKACHNVTMEDETSSICAKAQPCFHQIINGKIVSVRVTRKEPRKYFQFYFSATFQNKLRPRNEEIIRVLIGEKGNVISAEDFREVNIFDNDEIEIQDFKAKLDVSVFDELKTIVNNKLDSILKEKVALFDIPLANEKKSKLRNFEKRLRRQHHEQITSRKNDFDMKKWQVNYEALLKREEESLATHIAVKFINLLSINTTKVSFEVNLDNNSTIHGSFILGVNHVPEVTCPICQNTFFEGYATEDSLYVCKNCIRQSIDTSKVYSTKAALKLDEALNEYFEQDSGFICSVCGKRHSRLLEFKCSHDNSSVCIYHYGTCDVCGKVFSKLNLVSTQEFKRKLCPNHYVTCENCQAIIGVDEGRVSKVSGKRLCSTCIDNRKER